MKRTHAIGLVAGTMIAKRIFERWNEVDLKDKTILITGGTTGLGFELMQQLLEQHAQIAICARDSADLQKIKENYPQVFVHRCDVGVKDEVEEFVRHTIDHYGKVDIVINNAGIIMVAPMEGFTHHDYEHAMSVMYWGIVHTTFAVLDHMKERGQGQIINITSIGGKVSIPHLLPYSAAKFAAVGFSEGIAAELKQHHIDVTTVVPGLMRTGSYINALFQEDSRLSYKLFSAASTAPLITISAEKAARGIIEAIKKRKSLTVLGLPAKILLELHHFFPETLTKLMGLTAKALPGFDTPENLIHGKEMRAKFSDTEVSGLESIGLDAQKKFQTQGTGELSS